MSTPYAPKRVCLGELVPVQTRLPAPVGEPHGVEEGPEQGPPATTTVTVGSVLRGLAQDPFWVLIGLLSALATAVAITLIYGIFQIAFAIANTIHARPWLIASVLIAAMCLGVGLTSRRCWACGK